VGYVKAVGTTNRHENWTTGVVVEVDEETGEPTKVVNQGEPVSLTNEEQKKLEGLGIIFEDSSKEEYDRFNERQEQVQTVGADVAAAAPLLGPSSGPTQTPARASGEGKDK
jgi:hypothetical protein